MVLIASLVLAGFLLSYFTHLVTLNPIKISLILPLYGKVPPVPIIMLLLLAAILGGLLVYFGLLVKSLAGKVEGIPSLWKQKENKKIKGFLDKALELVSLGEDSKAVEYLEKYLEFNPKDILAVNTLGDIYYKQNDVEKALYLHGRARRMRPDSLPFKYKVMRDYAKQRNDKRVEVLVRQLIEDDPANIENFFLLQDILLRQKRFVDAYQCQKELLKRVSERDEKGKQQKILMGIRYEIGMEKASEGQEHEALKIFKDILKTDKNFIPAIVSMGDVYSKTKAYEDAVCIWESGYRTTSKNIFLTRLEKLYLVEEKPEEILARYRDIICGENIGIDVYVSFCMLLMRLEMLDEAEELLDNVPYDKSEFPVIAYLYGKMFEKRRNWKAAVEVYGELHKAAGFCVQAYSCTSCSLKVENWTGKCLQCNEWSSMEVVYTIPA